MAFKWSDVLAKLKGRETPTTPASEPSSAEPPVPRAEAEADPVQAEDPDPPAHEPVVNEEAAMENAHTQHTSPEPSPRQALSAYSNQDDVGALSDGRRVEVDAVARIYARALLEMAEAQGTIDETADEIEQLEALLHAQPHLAQLLTTPALNEAARRGMIERVFKGRVSDTVYKFLQVINAKERLESLPGILAAFKQLVAERAGIVEVDIHVAHRLDPAEAESVGQRIGESIGKQVVLHQYVEPELIGGLTIRIGDRLIDGSVATQLRYMRRQLIQTGREKARRQAAVQE